MVDDMWFRWCSLRILVNNKCTCVCCGSGCYEWRHAGPQATRGSAAVCRQWQRWWWRCDSVTDELTHGRNCTNRPWNVEYSGNHRTAGFELLQRTLGFNILCTVLMVATSLAVQFGHCYCYSSDDICSYSINHAVMSTVNIIEVAFPVSCPRWSRVAQPLNIIEIVILENSCISWPFKREQSLNIEMLPNGYPGYIRRTPIHPSLSSTSSYFDPIIDIPVLRRLISQLLLVDTTGPSVW